MTYIVTARKWRPQIFEEVVGQSHVTQTLKNAIISGKIAHSFIFSGGRGSGKTSTARIFAKSLNCRYAENATPCNKCDICVEVTENHSLDVIEIDGASNRGIEEIQKIREAVRYAPIKGKYKIYIIDEVHMLTTPAFNALLKTLEEPPQNVIFIFATTEIHKVPATILSRCQRYNFKRIGLKEIADRISLIAKSENISIDENSLITIAKKADGAMRDAQSIFDQVVSFCGENIKFEDLAEALNIIDDEFFFRFTDAIKNRNTIDGLKLVEEIINSGYDLKEFLSGVADHLRNLLIAKTASVEIIETSSSTRNRYLENVKDFSEQDILRTLKIIEDLQVSMRYSAQPRFKLEVCIIQLTKMERSVEIDNLLNEINEFKKKILIDKPETQTSFRPTTQSEFKPRFSITIAKSDSKPATEKIEELKPNSSITIDNIAQKWGEFVSSFRKDKKISIATVIQESKPLKIFNSTLIIGVVDDFHSSTILRSKEYISEIFFAIYNSRVLISTQIVEGDTQIISTEKKEDIKKTENAASHPIEDFLHKEFGAESV